ncbi:MAG: hypothetical protein DI539_19135 [Flavobacterium psychrophilum]|jgi:hypothetical protein|nr:MAG: hypothetical protein DI539_19135 [Flavobacterium psychrophilum]
MENNFRDIEWIERYLDRSLSEEERQTMERRLELEPDLKSKYYEHKQLIEGIRYSHIQNKLEQLRLLESSLPPVTEKQRVNVIALWKPVAIAASITLLIAACYFFALNPTPQELYANQFVPYPNVFEPTVRGNINTSQDKRTEAFRAYDQGDYATASQLFTELSASHSEPGILLLLGNSNLIIGKTQEAQNNFLELIANYDELEAQAKWYLALSYLKQGEGEKAQLILQELSDPQVTYSKKAKELLDNMK